MPENQSQERAKRRTGQPVGLGVVVLVWPRCFRYGNCPELAILSRRLLPYAMDLACHLAPPALSPGDTVRVVAPSSCFDRALVWRGLGWLRERYRVEFDSSMFSRAGTFAGTDQRRLDELNDAVAAPSVRAIVAARGGYGLTRIVHRVRWSGLSDSPKWLVGFSDLTALHIEAARLRTASLHAHNVGGLGRGSAEERQQWLDALEHPTRHRQVRGLEVWQSGTARGPLSGGNLTLLFTSAAAGRLYIPKGAILVLEDVTEPAYHVDRMLTALLVSGQLGQVAGVAIGDFADCPTGKFQESTLEVVRERLSVLGVPTVSGLGFGHGTRNMPLPLGLTGEIDGRTGSFAICPP